MINKKITTEVPRHNRESGGCGWLTYEVQGESQWRFIGVSVQVFVCLILLFCFGTPVLHAIVFQMFQPQGWVVCWPGTGMIYKDTKEALVMLMASVYQLISHQILDD